MKVFTEVCSNVPIKNIPALVQIMDWRRPGDKALSESMMVSYLRIYASLGLNEFRTRKEFNLYHFNVND